MRLPKDLSTLVVVALALATTGATFCASVRASSPVASASTIAATDVVPVPSETPVSTDSGDLLPFPDDRPIIFDTPAPTPPPVFSDGLLTLSDLIEMGDPIESAHLDDSGDVVQLTSAGLAYWLPDQNQPSFTDGYGRWALTGDGLISWQGDDTAAPKLPAPAPAPIPPSYSDPRSYLYANYPAYAPRMDCIIRAESGWNPFARNSHSTASGLAQFLNTTWASTPQGRAGLSVFDPYANIDGAIWLVQHAGWTQWETYDRGMCR